MLFRSRGWYANTVRMTARVGTRISRGIGSVLAVARFDQAPSGPRPVCDDTTLNALSAIPGVGSVWVAQHDRTIRERMDQVRVTGHQDQSADAALMIEAARDQDARDAIDRLRQTHSLSRAAESGQIRAHLVGAGSGLLQAPVDFDVWMNCPPVTPRSVSLVYRVNGGAFSRVTMLASAGGHYLASVPPVGHEARVDYYIETTWPEGGAQPPVHTTPLGGAADALIYFVSERHTADLDESDALLDIFDVVRMVRHVAWGEPVRAADRLEIGRAHV